MRRIHAALLPIVLPLLLAAALLGGSQRTTRAAGRQVTATIENFAFGPQALHIAVGDTVTWTNKDTAPHTVTSDTGAWADSGDLSQGQSFSHTFSKAGSYAYHCAVHPTMIATVVVGAASTSGTQDSGAMSMGPMQMSSRMAFTGWYDDHRVLYLSTDTSSKAEAAMEHINYAPSLAKSLPQASSIYLVTNGRFAARGAVFGSQPGADDYTPLWQEVQVRWTDPAAAVALGSDDQIKGLAKAGKLTLTRTGVVLNCPIIKVLAS